MGISCATSDSDMGGANINDQVTKACRVERYLTISISMRFRPELGVIPCLNLVTDGPEEGTERGDHPFVRLGST